MSTDRKRHTIGLFFYKVECTNSKPVTREANGLLAKPIDLSLISHLETQSSTYYIFSKAPMCVSSEIEENSFCIPNVMDCDVLSSRSCFGDKRRFLQPTAITKYYYYPECGRKLLKIPFAQALQAFLLDMQNFNHSICVI